MKRILVPTDFSPVADNALEYALEVAADFSSDIYLYHVYTFDKVTYDNSFAKDNQPFAKEMERQMRRTAAKFLDKAREKNIRLRTFVEEETFYSLFNTRVLERDIDLIIMGSKGASGLSRLIFGSVAATALETSKVPLLIIPPGYAFCPFQNIILSIDQKELTGQVLAPLKELALRYGARVTLLHISAEAKKQPDTAPVLSLEGIETSFMEIRASKSIGDSIGRFVQQQGCDILCMVRRERSFFEKVFRRSITRVQAFRNQVPLLVLPEG